MRGETMEVTLYKNFSKRKNSTKQPTNVDGVTKNLTLKDKCSYINPSFFLSDAEGYVYLEAWGNYYFINGVEYDINGAQYITCSIDVLATWKESILATTAFVKYSTSNYSLNIVDDRVAPLVAENTYTATASSIFVQDEAYIITVISQDGGVVNFYAGYAGLQSIVESLLSKTTSWWQSIFASLSDALSALIGVMAIPITDLSTGTSRQVYLGSLDLEIGTLPTLVDVRTGYKVDTAYIEIPRTYTDFRRGSKFTNISLYLPYVGVVDISADDVMDSEGLSIKTVANAMTGNVIYRVGNDQGEWIGTYSGTFGRRIPVSNIQLTNVAQSITQMVSAGATMAGILGVGTAGVALGSGLTMAAGASAISSGISAFSKFTQKSNTLIGGYNGSYGEFIYKDFYLSVVEQGSRIEPSNLTELYGNPCSKVLSLSNLSGYVETIGFSIDISAPSVIRDMINSAVDNGIYIE